MSDNLYSKKSIIKERISELKTKKFRFEINRIQLPNGHEGEYGQIIFPNAALAVPITADNKVILLRQLTRPGSRISKAHQTAALSMASFADPSPSITE